MIKTLTKKIIGLTFIAGMCFSAAFSQYTLQSSNLPILYARWEYKTTDTLIQPSTGGAGVIWDNSLHTVTVNTQIEQYKLLDMSTADSAFPTANLKKLNFLGWTDYYHVNAAGTEFQYLGLQNSANEIHITNTQNLLTVPFTYGGSIVNAPLTGTGTFGATLSGNISVQADGYGTVKIGQYVYNNATRIKTDMDMVLDFGGVFSNVHLVKYSWYKASLNSPCFEIVTFHSDGPFGDSNQKFVLVTNRVNVGVDEIADANLNFSAYPNPAKDLVNVDVKVDRPSDVTLQLMDIIGRVKVSKTSKLSAGEHNLKLEVSDLPKGVYILSVISGTINRQQRLVISE